MATTTFKLNTGASIPVLGLGTWQSEPGQVETAVAHALNVGYKHIDCAYMYGNEDEVGAGLKEAFSSGKVARKDIFLTTKLWCTFVGHLPFHIILRPPGSKLALKVSLQICNAWK